MQRYQQPCKREKIHQVRNRKGERVRKHTAAQQGTHVHFTEKRESKRDEAISGSCGEPPVTLGQQPGSWGEPPVTLGQQPGFRRLGQPSLEALGHGHASSQPASGRDCCVSHLWRGLGATLGQGMGCSCGSLGGVIQCLEEGHLAGGGEDASGTRQCLH